MKMPKRTLVFSIALLFLTVVVLLVLKSNRISQAQNIDPDLIGNEITLYQFFQNKTALNSILASILLNPNKERLLMTIIIDVDENNKFEKNEIAVSELSTFSEGDLPNAAPVLFKDRKQIKKLLDQPFEKVLKARIILTNASGTASAAKHVLAKKVMVDVGEIFDPAPGFIGGVGGNYRDSSQNLTYNWVSRAFAQGIIQEPKVPVKHPNVPDINGRAGKPNECVPISLANSLQWLAKTHNFENKLPTTSGELINELASDVKWTKDGVKYENILPGKEEFTKRRGLPIINKKIDNEIIEGKSTLWEKIVQELNDGEDVELIIDFKQSPKGNPTKGHAVTVVGADKVKNKQTITVHDSATPQANDTYEIDRNGQIVGYPFGKVYGNFIISESHISPSNSPTPSLPPSPSIEPSPRYGQAPASTFPQ